MASTVAESSPPETSTTADFTGNAASAAKRGEPRARLARGLGAGVARDDVLERVACTAPVALLRLGRRDSEHRVGRLWRLRVAREDFLLRLHGARVVLEVR